MGSIKSKGNNKYELTVSSGYGLNGKRQRYYKTVEASSLKKAEKALIQFQAEVDSGNHLKPEKLTFENFAKDWLEKYAKGNTTPKTFHRYKELLDLRIIPAFGALPLEKIKPMHLLQFYESLKKDGVRMDGKKGGLSGQTIKHHHRVVSAMLETAVKWQLLSDNVARRVEPPKVKPKDINFYDEKQLMTLIEKLNTAPDKYKVAIMLLIFTGMRRSELMGLQWQDVDLIEGAISVKRDVQYINKLGEVIGETKNLSSKRKIGIPQFIVDLLKGYKAIQDEMKIKSKVWHDTNYIIIKEDGTGIRPNTLNKWFDEFIIYNNLPKISIHGLRHAHATILIANNTDIVTVSRRLGHAKTSTTLNIYAHAISNSEKATSDKLEKILLPTYKKESQNIK